MPTLYTPRYEAQPTNPPQVWDYLLQKRSSTHISFESAAARSWTLNRFSTGSGL